MARAFGVEVQELSRDEVGEHWPLARLDDIEGGVLLPEDAQTNPVDTTMALAKGARALGVQILEDTPVTAIRSRSGRVSEVVTDGGSIRCDAVVNCAGMWAREVGRMCDVAGAAPRS